MKNQTIYLDMDGVVADWVRGAMELHGQQLPIADVRWHIPVQMGFASEGGPAFWTPMENPHYWRNLSPLNDGMSLYARIVERLGAESLNILSSGRCRCSVDGKLDWLRRWMPNHVDCAVFAHRKERVAGPGKILVDDHETNVERFVAAGGAAVLIPRPWNYRRDECGWDGSFNVDDVWTELKRCVEGVL